MKIPAYWSQASAEDTDRDGKNVSMSCWRWSDTSESDAFDMALTAAKGMLRNFLSGSPSDRYTYGTMPMREEVVQRLSGAGAETVAVVTQNAYGSLVLNTAGVMFIDVDFPPVSAGEQTKYLLKRLFNKGLPSPEAKREAEARSRLDRFLSDNSQWSVRCYRTRAGLRILATHALFDPVADTTHALFASVGADPLYMRLCKLQECFRARLTPKPWRCGHRQTMVRWPRETDDARDRFDKWQAAYADRQANYATCRFLGALGPGAVHPEVERIVELHDQVTRCHEPLALA